MARRKKRDAHNSTSEHNNVQHSSDGYEDFTPPFITDRVRLTLVTIDLDPASCPEANLTINAKRIYTEADDGLSKPWRAKTVFVNPPGGAIKEEGERQKSRARLWWEKAVHEWQVGNARSVIFLAFTLELFKSGQMNTHAPYVFPFVVPRIRIPFDKWDPEAGARVKQTSPTHSNAIILLPDVRDPGMIPRFGKYFEEVGQMKLSWGI